MGTSLTKSKLFLHKVIIINTLSPALLYMLYASCIKLFVEALELFMHAVFQVVIICKMVSMDCIPQETKLLEVRWCSNRSVCLSPSDLLF